MGTKEPMPGLCGAKSRRGGGYCAARPMAGKTRCRVHGGMNTGDHLMTHGLRSRRLAIRYSDPAIRERLEQLLDDPDLLNMRRPVALSQVALEGVPMEPTEGEVRRLAQKLTIDDAVDGEAPADGPAGEPSEEMMEAARNMLRTKYAATVVENANAHQRTTALAAKQEKVAELLVRGAVPILRRFAERVAGLVRKELPPTRQAEFLLNLRRIIDETQLEIVRLGEEADNGGKGNG